MNTDEATAWLRARGYEVEQERIWHVEGHGMVTRFSEEGLVSLCDEEAHTERALQATETTQETFARHERDGGPLAAFAPPEPPA